MTHGDLIVRSAQLSDASVVDIGIKDGRIVEVSSSSAHTYAEELDAHDFCVLPSFVEPHAHLDKAFLADRVHNPAGDLMGAIEGLQCSPYAHTRRHHRKSYQSGHAHVAKRRHGYTYPCRYNIVRWARLCSCTSRSKATVRALN